MAVETAEKFLELLAEDGALQTQFNTTNPQGTEEVLQFAGAKGFLFSEEDLLAALEDVPEDGMIRQRLGEPQQPQSNI